MKATTKNLLLSHLATLLLPIVAGVLLYLYCDIKIENIPLHSTLEASGGVIAIIIAIVFFIKYRSTSTITHLNWATLGLLVMGVFDIFHATVSPGELFVWLHTIAVFFGGLVFMTLIFFEKKVTPTLYHIIPLLFASFAGALSIGFILLPSSIPLMIDAHNNFTTTANVLNFIGGFGFIVGSLFFSKQYLQTQKIEEFLFAGHSMLFGVAGLLFMSSQLWDMQWWLWHFLRLIAYMIAFYFLYIEYQKEILKVEQLAITDSLTQLYNRGYFTKIAQKEIERAKRDNTTLTFAMLDVDYFKNYNDTYGHSAGDDVLKSIAKCMMDYTSRASDYAFRVGGEEFVLLFCGLKRDASLAHLQKFLNAVETLKIEHTSSQVSSFVTLSIGAKSYHAEEIPSFSQIYKEIDDLLYRAKKSGRNQIVMAE